MSRRRIGVRISLLPTKDGGRSGPVLTGYRSLLRFEGTTVDFGFELELDPEFAVDGLEPGATGSAQLSLWAFKELPALHPGQRFELREGIRVVGTGTIVDA